MEIAIISDTHLRRASRRLPKSCIERLRAADLIVHAGDIGCLLVLRELQSHGEVIAVHGNVDEADVRALLPKSTIIEADTARIGIVHDAGPSRGRLQRLRGRFSQRSNPSAQADAVIFGHSHLPCHELAPDGFQIFNPGSPTQRRRAPRHTMGVARVQAGVLSFELVSLD